MGAIGGKGLIPEGLKLATDSIQSGQTIRNFSEQFAADIQPLLYCHSELMSTDYSHHTQSMLVPLYRFLFTGL